MISCPTYIHRDSCTRMYIHVISIINKQNSFLKGLFKTGASLNTCDAICSFITDKKIQHRYTLKI